MKTQRARERETQVDTETQKVGGDRGGGGEL